MQLLDFPERLTEPKSSTMSETDGLFRRWPSFSGQCLPHAPGRMVGRCRSSLGLDGRSCHDVESLSGIDGPGSRTFLTDSLSHHDGWHDDEWYDE